MKSPEQLHREQYAKQLRKASTRYKAPKAKSGTTVTRARRPDGTPTTVVRKKL